MMVIRESLITADEFFEIADLPENQDRRLELDNGVITEMPSSRPINTVIAATMSEFLGAYVRKRKLGYVTSADGGFKLSESQVRQPDAAFVSKARYATLPDVFEGGPDIAVEVISPREDALGKATEYLNAGTELVWVIYPDKHEVHVLRKTEPRWVELSLEDMLTGGDVLPDFSVPVRDIFPSVDE